MVLQARLPLEKLWKNFVFSSPAFSHMALLLSLHVSSRSCSILDLCASSSVRVAFASTEMNHPPWSSVRSTSWC